MSLLDRARRWLRGRGAVMGINRRNLDLVYRDYRPGRFEDLDDKLRSKKRMDEAGIATPRTLGVVHNANEIARLGEILAPHDEAVIKPATGSGGKGILVLKREGDHWSLPGGRKLTLSELQHHVADVLSGVFSLDEDETVAIIEERIHPHPFLVELYPEGLADLRVILHDRKPVQAMWRLPTHASDGKANLHGGGVGVGVDLETGRTTHAVCSGRPVREHPDSGRALVDIDVPLWSECLELARRASGIVDVEYVGVDITLDATHGALILEINARPGLEIQVANRAPVPVGAAVSMGRLDQLGFLAAWLLLIGIAGAPLVYRFMGARWDSRVATLSLSSFSVAAFDDDATQEGSIEWADEETSLSDQNAPFAQARMAAADGDTSRALILYGVAAEDSSIAPFALNNIAILRRRQGDLSSARSALDEAIARYPTYYRGHYNLGLLYLDAGQPALAMSSFEETLRLRPSHAAAWGKKGELLHERGEMDAAIVAYRQAIRFQPDTRRQRMALGMALRDTGDYAAASESFLEVLRLRPQHASALHGWAQSALDEARDRGSALRASLADSLVERLSAHTREHGSALRHRALLAQLHWQRGESGKALRQFRRLSEGEFRPSFFARAAAIMALELGLWDEAQDRFDALRADDDRLARRQLELCDLGRSLSSAMEDRGPSNEATGRANAVAVRARTLLEPPKPDPVPGSSPALRLDLERRLEDVASAPESLELWAQAYLAHHEGNEERERMTLDALAQFHPDFEPQQRRLFRAAIARGDLDAAEAAGRRIRTLAPRDREVLAGLCEISLSEGELARARRALSRMSQGDRESPSVRRLEGRLLLEEGRPQDAIRALEAAVRGATPELESQRLLADAYFGAGRDDDGAELLTSILIREPGRLEARERLARALMELRRYREAVQEWRRVLGLGGENNSHLFNLALCLQRDRRYHEAIGIYDRVLRLKPALYRAHYNRALAWEKLGRPDEAAAGFRRVLELKPGHEGSLQHLVELQFANEEN